MSSFELTVPIWLSAYLEHGLDQVDKADRRSARIINALALPYPAITMLVLD